MSYYSKRSCQHNWQALKKRIVNKKNSTFLLVLFWGIGCSLISIILYRFYTDANAPHEVKVKSIIYDSQTGKNTFRFPKETVAIKLSNPKEIKTSSIIGVCEVVLPSKKEVLWSCLIYDQKLFLRDHGYLKYKIVLQHDQHEIIWKELRENRASHGK